MTEGLFHIEYGDGSEEKTAVAHRGAVLVPASWETTKHGRFVIRFDLACGRWF